MNRFPWLLKIDPRMKTDFDYYFRHVIPERLSSAGASNISIWSVADLVFGYCESHNESMNSSVFSPLTENLADSFAWIAHPGEMRLMFSKTDLVLEDKEQIRHRVFATKLKPGCAEEYKHRHDLIAQARKDKPSPSRDSNMTIWNKGDYIWGYCEKIIERDTLLSDQEKENMIAWETRQLEIMDWLTDDVDWIFGTFHPHIERIFPVV